MQRLYNSVMKSQNQNHLCDILNTFDSRDQTDMLTKLKYRIYGHLSNCIYENLRVVVVFDINARKMFVYFA